MYSFEGNPLEVNSNTWVGVLVSNIPVEQAHKEYTEIVKRERERYEKYIKPV